MFAEGGLQFLNRGAIGGRHGLQDALGGLLQPPGADEVPWRALDGRARLFGLSPHGPPSAFWGSSGGLWRT